MDIGIVNPELIYPRGAEKQICKLSYHLNKMGHDVTIYTFEKEKNYLFDDLLENTDIISLNRRWIVNNLFFLNHFRWYYLIKKLSTKLKKHDVINVHNHPAQWISKFTEIPVIWMCNEPYRQQIPNQGIGKLYPANLMDSNLSLGVDLILAISPVIKQAVEKKYPGKKVITVGSGVDLEREIKYVENNYFDSIFVGPIHPQKRPLDIVMAFSQIKDKIPNIRLHFVGNVLYPHLKKEMQKKAFDNNIKIFFYGTISNEKLYELYEIADIAVFVPESEPWGIFPLETTLAGIPTIISDQCGIKNILSKDFPVVETGNISQLTIKILEIKENYVESVNKTTKISKMLSEKYSWENYSKKLLDIFNNVLDKNKF